MTGQVLFPRFRADGRAVVDLGPKQRAAHAEVAAKIADGRWRFQDLACPSCGATTAEPIAAKERFGLPLTTVMCGACGLLRFQPHLAAEAYEDFYVNHYRTLYRGGVRARDAFARQGPRGRRIKRFVDRHLGPGRGARAGAVMLDVGCAAGGIVQVFQDAGWEAHGLDYNTDHLSHGRAKGLDLHFGGLVAAGRAALGGGQADLIVYSHVLEHVVDLAAELAAVRAHLAPGGQVFVRVPGLLRLHLISRGDLIRFVHIAHVYGFCLGTLGNVMARAGFEMVAGDERVQALFRVAAGPAPGPRLLAGPVRDYLRRCERARHWPKPLRRLYFAAG